MFEEHFLIEAKPAADIVLASHFEHASEVFARFGIHVSQSHYFSTLEEQYQVPALLREIPGLIACPRRHYFAGSPLPFQRISFPSDRPVIGIHLHGSTFSIDAQQPMGVVSKDLPAAVLHRLLVDDRFNIILFGSPHELSGLGLNEQETLALPMLSIALQP